MLSNRLVKAFTAIFLSRFSCHFSCRWGVEPGSDGLQNNRFHSGHLLMGMLVMKDTASTESKFLSMTIKEA